MKACISKQTREFDFPDRNLVNKSYSHNLLALSDVAGLSGELTKSESASKDFERNWAIVLNWSEESRYQAEISQEQASELFEAVDADPGGVLTWLKKWW